jgi:hypothetical protein
MKLTRTRYTLPHPGTLITLSTRHLWIELNNRGPYLILRVSGR